MPQPQSQFAASRNVSIDYTVHGSGTPLILLHGGGPGANGLSNYSRNVAALAEHFTCWGLRTCQISGEALDGDHTGPLLITLGVKKGDLPPSEWLKFCFRLSHAELRPVSGPPCWSLSSASA